MIRKLLLTFAILVLLIVFHQAVTFPRVGRLVMENPSTTAFMERRRAELRSEGKSDRLEHQWVPYEEISPHLPSAVIVSEDSRFFDHRGVDTEELEKILKDAWETRELGRGGSTITQQLAKNLYLSPSRNPWRKLKELLIAKRIEQVLTKKRILELYLNLVELGEGIYGAEAAARHYFGKSAATLTPSEAALLAGALPNPRKMNPGNPGPYLRGRRDIIVSRMRRWGYMAEESIAKRPDEPPAGSESDRDPTITTAPDPVPGGEPDADHPGPGGEPDAGDSLPEPEIVHPDPTGKPD